MILLFIGQQGAHAIVGGAVALDLTAGFTTRGQAPRARVSLALTATFRTSWHSEDIAGDRAIREPEIIYEVAFDSVPLSPAPVWDDLSDRSRAYGSARGRSYEFDRMETGTFSAALDNRDSALSPDNSASAYAPVKSTRPIRARAVWDTTYPLFRGISEGYPQSYPSLGKDAVVQLQGNDPFYALNNARFTPATTTLTTALAVAEAGAEETITVASTALPLPQAVPFTIRVGGLIDGWLVEELEVQEIVSATEYLVLRGGPIEHPAMTVVETDTVSFGEEMSGIRIQNVLYAVGFLPTSNPSVWPSSIVPSGWWDLELGQTLISASEDLRGVNPLEHIQLIAEAEFGRFFAARDGRFTFRDRHSVYVDHLTPDITFAVETDPGGSGDDAPWGEDYGESWGGSGGSVVATDSIPFVLDGPLSHTDEKLYNRAKITVAGGDYAGTVVDMADDASIVEHFERVYERTFPYANLNDAESAARYVLSHSAETEVRLPGITVFGARDPNRFWPLILGREIGDRARFVYMPEGGGDEIDRALAIDGIVHAIAPMQHNVTFRCTEVSSLDYWILGRAGYSELGSTTRVAF